MAFRARMLLAAAAALTWLAATGSSHAATAVLTPSADAYVSSGSPLSNTGGETKLVIDASPRRDAYLRFDVSGIQMPIARATLMLYAQTTSSTGISVLSASSAWSEHTIAYEGAPAAAAPSTTSAPFAASRWLAVDVTELITGDGPHTLVLRTASTSSRTFPSREWGVRAPQLIIETEASAPGLDPVLVAAGNIACDPASTSFNDGAGTATQCRQRATAELIAGGDYHSVLALGDLQYEDGTLSKFGSVYDATWGLFKARTRPVPGNHDHLTAGAEGYFDYFGHDAGERGDGWYSFDVGAWHIVALNSNCAAVGGCNVGSRQEQWLKADLAASTTPCLLAYMHHPRFSSAGGVSSSPTPLWQLLQAEGADLVLNGHAHVYERFARQTTTGAVDRTNGVRQFTVGTGGRGFHSLRATARNSGRRERGTFGALALTLRPDGYDWRFAGIAGSSFRDSGSDTCTGSLPDSIPPSAPTGLLAASAGPGATGLSWSASQDDDGVALYRILRDGQAIGDASGESFTDVRPTPDTLHTYEVVALDGSGNVSPPSNPVAARATGERLVFTAVADASVRMYDANRNFGLAPRLEVDAQGVEHTLLRFRVEGIGERQIVSARLRLHTLNASGSGGRVHASAGAWEEGTVTWATAPPFEDPYVASFGKVSAGVAYEVAVTPLVAGDGVVNMRLTSTSTDGADYASREATAGEAPQLIVAVE